MLSFPLMSELPASLDTIGWTWAQISMPNHSSNGFWVGTDPHGNRWLTKLRGSFYAYREIVFARLAQAMNWSCQSTVFIRLDADSAQVLGRCANEIHAAHWFLEEHPHPPCHADCALQTLVGREVHKLDDLSYPRIAGLIDWPRSEIAAYVFGGNEPPGRLFTLSHELVIIDSEQMFSTGPRDFSNSLWLRLPSDEPSTSGLHLARDMCKEIGSLHARTIEIALTIPSGLPVDLGWQVAPKLNASVQFAANYARGADASQVSRYK